MKIAISGGQGFIGKNLSIRLSKMGHKTYPIPRDDLSNKELLRRELEDINPDYIYHLAAYGNHSQQDDAEKTIGVNILKTYNLLEATKYIPYKCFINFSSSAVALPFETFYTATKAAGERLCNVYKDQFKKTIITVRPASVFGEGEASFRFIPTVIKHLLNSHDMSLDPYPSHSWIYVQDFIDALLKVVENFKKIERDEVVNISYGKQWSNLDIVQMLEELTGKRLFYKQVEKMRPYDTKDWLVDNMKLFSFAWQPKYGIDHGLLETFKYYETYGFDEP